MHTSRKPPITFQILDIEPMPPKLKLHIHLTKSPKRDVRTKGYSTVLLDPTQVESKKSSQIQWPVPSINAEPVDIFLGEE